MDEPEIICMGAPMFNPRHKRTDWRELGGDVYELQITPARVYCVHRDSYWSECWKASLVLWPDADSPRKVVNIQADLPGLSYLHPSREMALCTCERDVESRHVA